MEKNKTKSLSYHDLEVWQKSIQLAEIIYGITADFPAREIYGLGNQLRRSAVSVASNIAEGQARNSRKEFIHFLSISLGSLAEMGTQLTIATKILYISESKLAELLAVIADITRMIRGLIRHLKATR